MRKLFFLILVTFALIIFPPIASAQETEVHSFMQGESVILDSNEVVNKDFFAAGEKVEIKGVVRGDAYIAAADLFVSGTIEGDLLAVGGNIEVSGEVKGSIRAVGGNFTLNGLVGKNVSFAGGNFETTKDSNITSSLSSAVGTAIISGAIGKDINLAAGNSKISANVAGDINAATETLSVEDSATIGGNLSLISENQANISQSASVSGNISQKKPPEQYKKNLNNFTGRLESYKNTFTQTGRVISFFAYLIIGLFMVKLFPKYSQNNLNTLTKMPGKSFVIGFGALFVTPFALIIIALTIIGIPIAFFLFAFYLIYLYLAKMFVILLAGDFLYQKATKKKDLALSYIIGLVVYSVIVMIPYIDGVVKFFAIIFGLGAMLITCKATFDKAREKEIF